MKIKAVCELTGLTDRTIRYYIEEKLISPLYTENYLGRKTYNFSEKDIDDLNDIAVLRKFDFTLEEIKSVINDAETSREILSNVKDRTAQAVLNGQNKLSVLLQISSEKTYTVAKKEHHPFGWCSFSFPKGRAFLNCMHRRLCEGK